MTVTMQSNFDLLDITESFNTCFENNADLGRLIHSFSQK